MSNTAAYRTGKLKDKDIIKTLKTLEAKFGKIQSNVHLGNIPLTSESEDIKLLEKSNDTAITSFDYVSELHKFTVRFRRGVAIDQDKVGVREASAYYDELYMIVGTQRSPSQQAPSTQEIIECNRLLSKFAEKNISKNLGDSGNEPLDLLQRQLTSLSSLHEKMVSDLSSVRSKLSKDYTKRQKELEQNHLDRLEELKSLNKIEEDKLTKISSDLDAREKELDDREHMHVRRELSGKINDDIKSRLEKTLVSKSSNYIRMFILWLSLSATFLLAFLSIYSLNEYIEHLDMIANREKFINLELSVYKNKEWFLMLKGVLSSIGSVGFLLYSLKWLRELYNYDNNRQKELEMYAYDINRASWAIETIMESQLNKNSLPPQTWIDAVCNNLFNSSGVMNKNERLNPLGEFLSSCTHIELGSEGTKFEVNKKGVKQLANKIKNNE